MVSNGTILTYKHRQLRDMSKAELISAIKELHEGYKVILADHAQERRVAGMFRKARC